MGDDQRPPAFRQQLDQLPQQAALLRNVARGGAATTGSALKLRAATLPIDLPPNLIRNQTEFLPLLVHGVAHGDGRLEGARHGTGHHAVEPPHRFPDAAGQVNTLLREVLPRHHPHRVPPQFEFARHCLSTPSRTSR